MTYEESMVLPRGAALMQEEEMRYVEGGKMISKSACKAVFLSLAINPTAVVAGAFTAYVIAQKIITFSSTVGGLLGVGIYGLGSWAAGQLLILTVGLARGAINKGVDVTFNINILKKQFGVNCSVKY